MKVYALAVAILVGMASPLVTSLASPVAAQPHKVTRTVPLPKALIGTFGDGNWFVTVSEQNGVYRYSGYDRKNSKSIELSGAIVTNQGGKRLYTWRNGDTKYRVIWQPKDQDYVRLQVIQPNRKEVLNRLLSRQEEGC
jgi:hypothetical protein